jgi:hypothetical protein
VNEDFLAKYYRIASNETSRKLIFLLGEYESFKATELIEKLDISPGTFYDALKRLKGIIEKADDGRYRLTNTGKRIYYMLLEESKGFHTIPSSMTSFVFSLPYLFPISFFKNIDRQGILMLIIISHLVLVGGMIGMMMSGLIPVVLMMLPPYLSISSISQIILFLVNSALVISLSYFLSSIFGYVKNSIRLCLGVLVSFIPIVIFSILYYVFYNNFFIKIFFIYYFLIYLIPLFFSFTLLTTCIFYYVNLRIEAAFMISLILLLISLIASLFFLNIIMPGYTF